MYTIISGKFLYLFGKFWKFSKSFKKPIFQSLLLSEMNSYLFYFMSLKIPVFKKRFPLTTQIYSVERQSMRSFTVMNNIFMNNMIYITMESFTFGVVFTVRIMPGYLHFVTEGAQIILL